MKKSIEQIKADYHLFIDIQMGKYLSSKGKSEFDNPEEAKAIMDRIVNAYNQKIASDHLRLDNLNETAKTSWFNSIEIDFNTHGSVLPPAEEIQGFNRVAKEFISYYNEVFSFLPEGAIINLMNAGPALEAYGYPLERFKKIMTGEELTDFEEHIITWAHDIAFGVANAFFEINKIKKEKLLAVAALIANEELDEETSFNVVSEIYANIEKNYIETKKSNKKVKASAKTIKKKKKK